MREAEDAQTPEARTPTRRVLTVAAKPSSRPRGKARRAPIRPGAPRPPQATKSDRTQAQSASAKSRNRQRPASLQDSLQPGSRAHPWQHERQAEPTRERRSRARAEPARELHKEQTQRRAIPKTTADDQSIRLNKRMAELGLASRREADEWIENGWVRVNGKVARMGQPVRSSDRIEVDPAAQRRQRQSVTILIHKPVGIVSAQAEGAYQPAVSLVKAETQYLPPGRKAQAFERRHLKGLAVAGRLDIDSTGLLVLTQDGRIARALIGDDSNIEKEYLVRVRCVHDGQIREKNIQAVFPPEKLALLKHGLALDGVPLKPAKVSWQNEEQLRVVLREGRKRQIRRMCEAVGLEVTALKRVRIGRVVLGDLPVGQWRYLSPFEKF